MEKHPLLMTEPLFWWKVWIDSRNVSLKMLMQPCTQPDKVILMAFQASGPHAADRAMEGNCFWFMIELKRFPEKKFWDKPMGKFNIQLNKKLEAHAKRNKYGGRLQHLPYLEFSSWLIMASLITGNPCIVKPHPGAILAMAIVVAEIQKVLKENGIGPKCLSVGS